MFTGIVEETGFVREIARLAAGARVTVAATTALDGKIGRAHV